MRIKYKLIDKIKNLTTTEMNFLLYIATKQNLSGRVIGVHNQDVCKNTGMCKQSFYTALRGLEKKNIIQVFKASETDYDIIINDNDFEDKKTGGFDKTAGGYINLQRKIFHRKQFKKLKAKEKWLLMYFLHITHENSSSYHIGTKTFYQKFSKLLGVTKRVIRSYLHNIKAFFSVGIVKGIYYITYKHSIFNPVIGLTTEQLEHENFVAACIRRCKIREVDSKNFLDTVELIKQYRNIAKELNYNIYTILQMSIRTAAEEKIHPKNRTLNSKYIHKLVRKALALY